ncbi:MAG: ribonuclease III [Clostridia bacterium]|nr:ribonuclease III [Clostridia bacterium]
MKNLEQKLGYKFNNIKLLELAMSHTSYANEIKGKESNERIEFLGDAVLELIASEYIYATYPKLPEGEMTKTRAYAVCEDSLAIVANKYSFSDFLLVGKCEAMQNGKYRNSILADAVEATIGAIFLDGGFENAKRFILPNIIPQIEDYIKHGNKDYKTQLQEKLQVNGEVKIEYRLIGEKGPDHAKIFDVEVYCDDILLGAGEGKSKKDAEMNAAKVALEKYNK